MAGAVALIVGATSLSASTVYQAKTAYRDDYGRYGDGHSLTLNGQKYQFEEDGKFVDHGETATLTGTLKNGAGDGFTVSMLFNLFVEPNIPSPKLELKSEAYAPEGPVDPATWKFWDVVEGGVSQLIGLAGSANEGLDFNILSKPLDESYAFQSGIGANGKNINFGLSGWLFLEGASPAAMQVNDCGAQAGQTCDFNIDLVKTPLPASALLLIGGIAGLGAMRKRKAAA